MLSDTHPGPQSKPMAMSNSVKLGLRTSRLSESPAERDPLRSRAQGAMKACFVSAIGKAYLPDTDVKFERRRGAGRIAIVRLVMDARLDSPILRRRRQMAPHADVVLGRERGGGVQ
ncbi:hypothetical protein EAH83_13380 [Variovorax ginsengisoli]|nr:hypothetical protein EAH83_13380 [Variovorax ginsengisoli]